MATNDAGSAPRAVIHKRILDAAERLPDASLEVLAAELPGASPELVERVLEEYGDPGDAGESQPASPDSAASTPDSPGSTHQPNTDPSDVPTTEPTVTDPPEDDTMPEDRTTSTAEALTEKQLDALRAIAERPDATQAELADHLGVSRATVNKRVNAIEGFEWRDRAAFVERVLDESVAEPIDDATETDAESPPVEPFTRSPETSSDGASPATDDSSSHALPANATSDGGQVLDPADSEAVEHLAVRIDALEQQLDAGGESGVTGFDDPDLIAKVLRAVMAADDIDETEELRVIKALL